MQLSYQAQGRSDMLRDRAKRCVCKYCGGSLHLKQLVFSEYDDARIEIFCRNCDRIEFGVEPQIYESAKYYVDQTSFDHYPDLDDAEQTHRMNVAKICEIMTWQDKMFGYIDERGFVTPPKKTPYLGECLHLTASELDELDRAEQTEQAGEAAHAETSGSAEAAGLRELADDDEPIERVVVDTSGE